MSETKHTKSPWEIRYGGQEGDTHFTVVGTEGDHVGVVAEYAVPAPRPWREVQANARLIVAAPELLAFAQFIVADRDHDKDAHYYNTPCEVCEAEKVIAKATGAQL